MRIMLLVAGGDTGGAKTHILSLARELSKDNELRIVSLRREVLSREAREMGIETADIDAKEGMAAAFRFALHQVEEYRPQIIHCHGSKANLFGVMIKALKHIPVMTTVHSDPRLDYMGAPLRKYTYGLLNAFALRHMDFYVAVANGMKNTLIERNFDPHRIMTIFNGMDFSQSDPSPRPVDPDKKEIWIGIAARLNPVKDIKTLIRAFDIAHAQDDRLRLSIAGKGEEENSLRAMVSSLGLDEVVRFEGWISDTKEYFKNIDINVLSSLSETFPYSLLEGVYEHCPAIASNVGGIPSLIKHGETGFLFEAGDAESFAKYILKLASDPALRSELAENLYKKASAEFSLERMKEDQQQVYVSALKRIQHKGRWGAVLCGAYGKGNAGDEAILKAILAELKELDPDMPFWVMSRKPMDTRKKAGVRSFYIFNIFSFLRALRHSQLFVNGGGSLIQDITSSRSLYFYLFTLKAARALGSKVIMYGCGIGPIVKKFDRWVSGKVLDSTAKIITLRDSGSMELLKELGVSRPEIILAADPTVSLGGISPLTTDNAFEEEGIDPGLDMIGFCLRDWSEFKDKDAVAEAARYAYSRYGLVPVFLPIEYPRDLSIGREMGEKLRDIPCHVCEKPKTVDQTMGMLSRMRLVCGMRLHSLIFATAGSTPVLGISYDVKVDSFIKDIGSDALIKLADLDAERLKAQIDNIMGRQAELGPQLGERLRLLEKENVKAAARLLNC